MRVLFITRSYPPQVGGMEKVSYELTGHISRLVTTHIIANRRGRKFLPFFMPYALFRALYLIVRYKIQVIHLSDGFMSIIGAAIKFFYKIPIAVTVHGLDVIYPNPLYQRLIPKCLAKLDKVICISRHTMDECIKRGIEPNQCAVIPNGVNRDEFILYEKKLPLELEKSLGISLTDKKILISVGHLVRRKGIFWFIKSVMPHLDKDVIFLAVGGYGNASSGNEKDKYSSLIKRLGLSGRVFLLGEVSSRILKVAYNCADLFIMPNIKINGDMEGFGIVLLEAASCGLPVIASDLEGIKDAVYDNQNGYLVESGNPDAYIKCISNYLSGKKIDRKKVRDFTMSKFEWRNIAKRYYQVFDELVN